MTTKHITVRAQFAVAPQRLWDVLADHEGMSRWAGAKVTVIKGPGDGGVGTVRRVKVSGLTIDEEVVVAEPPNRMVYRITRGLPVRFHRGEILITPADGGSELAWDVTMGSPIPGLARVILFLVRRGLKDGLRELEKELR